MNRIKSLIKWIDFFWINDKIFIGWKFVNKVPILIEEIVNEFMVQFDELGLDLINRVYFDFTGVNKVFKVWNNIVKLYEVNFDLLFLYSCFGVNF
jgi:hypothetical protein